MEALYESRILRREQNRQNRTAPHVALRLEIQWKSKEDKEWWSYYKMSMNHVKQALQVDSVWSGLVAAEPLASGSNLHTCTWLVSVLML